MKNIRAYHEFRDRYIDLELLANDDGASNHLIRVYRAQDAQTNQHVTIFAHEVDIVQDDTENEQKKENEKILEAISQFSPNHLVQYDLVYMKDEEVVVIYYGVVQGLIFDGVCEPTVRSLVLGLYGMGDIVHGNLRLESIVGNRIGYYGVGMNNVFKNEEEDQLLDEDQLSYVAPEVFDIRELTHKSDIFALGVCLLRLLTQTTIDVKSSDFNPEEVVQFAEERDVSLVELTLAIRCVSEDPKDRPTIAEIVQELGLLEDQSKKEEEKLYSYASESDQDEEEDDHYDMEFAEDAPVVQSAVVVPTYAENESWFPQEEKTKNLRQRRSSLTQSPRLQQSFASDAPQDIRSTVIRASHIQKEAPQQEMQAMFGFGAPKPASAPVTSTTSSVEITGGGGAPPPPMQAPVMSPPARPPAAKGGLPPQAPPSGDLKAEKQERKRKKIKDKAPILLLGRKESAQVVKAPPKPTVSRSESEKLSVFPSLKKARPITAKKIGKTLQRESVTSQSAPNVKQKEEEEIERVRQIMSENLSLSLDMEMQLRDSSNLYEYAPRYKAKRGFGFSLGGLFSGVSNLWKKVTTREPTRQTESAPTMGAYVPTETESGPISDGIVYDVAPASKVEPLVYPTAEGKVKFEKYKRIKRIGAGAQSTCILAKIGQEDVILKSFITSEEFNQEVGVLKRLQHKNIVGYIDSFSFLDADGDEKRYLVLEYCNQGDLSNLMKKYRKKKMPERLFVKVMLQILTGIDYIHENDHLHRDIKPKNLLMHNQVVKIGDFGFSSSVYDKTAVTGGSALYLSPEFVSNMYERKVDIWSIGCTAVEMVTHKERDMKLLLKQYKNANAVNETGHFLDSIWHEIHYSPWIKKALQNSLQEDHTKRISSKELLQCFTEHSSATTLQRVWRGYSARKRLRT